MRWRCSIQRYQSGKEVFHTALLSSSSSCCKSLQGYLKFLGSLQLEMVVSPNYLKLKCKINPSILLGS